MVGQDEQHRGLEMPLCFAPVYYAWHAAQTHRKVLELPLAVKSSARCGLWRLPLFEEVFPLRFSERRSLGCGAAVASLCHLLSPFLPLIFICPCLSCPSLQQKQNALCGCKPGVPNTLNNCSAARVNVKHKSASKFLLMPSYNNKNSHFNNWGRGRVDLVV